MQTTSAIYNGIIVSGDPYYETKLVIDNVGTFYETPDIFSISTSTRLFDGSPKIGSAVAAEIDVEMVMPTNDIPTIACLRPYIRAVGMAPKTTGVTVDGERLTCDGSTVSGENITFPIGEVAGENLIFPADTEEYLESEWIPQGVFYIDTRQVTQNSDGLDVLTIHGYDAMLKAEADYSSNMAVGDGYDTAYVRAIADEIGVAVDDRTWEIMGDGNIIPFPIGYSMREILGYIAALYVGSFIMTDEGKLRLISLIDLPTETNLLIDNVGDVLMFGYTAILI